MEGYDLDATNNPENPDRIIPKPGKNVAIGNGKVYGLLAALSYHVLASK